MPGYPENQTAGRRLAIIPVADCFGEPRFKRLLPPEHRIVAKKPDPTFGLIDYLIEGPSLAPILEEPPRAMILMTMSQTDDGRVRVDARWDDCAGADERSWLVGQWDSPESYREEMEMLDV